MSDPIIGIERKRQAIKNLVGDAPSFGMRDETIINWDDSRPQPSEDKIQAEVNRLKIEYDNKKYQRDRKEEYDQLNQFELIGEDSINGTTKHKEAILAIKAKHPKE